MNKMEDFAVIVPTRDRPRLLEFCKLQLSKQTVQPKWTLVDLSQPSGLEPDLVKRVRTGVEFVKNHGIDLVYIVEDDDCYPNTYFENLSFGDADFIGYSDTYYYSLKSKTWRFQQHPNRSSLFCTGFRISALDQFRWPPDHFMDLDIRLWEYARDHRKKVKLLTMNPTLGIKGHGEGKTVMKSHGFTFDHQDYDLNFLERRCETYQFEFYKDWIKTLK